MAYVREKKFGYVLELEDKPDNFKSLIKEFLSGHGFHIEEPIIPNEIIWSPRINLLQAFKKVPKEYKKSGVYRVYYDDTMIYIGCTQCDGTLKGKRQGMWARRQDFKSSLKGQRQTYFAIDKTMADYYYNGEKMPLDEYKRISHEFFVCHPDVSENLEQVLQQEYKDEHGDLPLLNRVENYVGSAKRVN